MEVKRIRFESGEDYSILLGDTKLPMPYPNLFLTINYRNSGSSPNSSYSVLQRIKFLYEILDYLEIDIERRCLTNEFLSKVEVQAIVRWSRLTVESFREQVAKAKIGNVIKLRPKQNRLETARAVIVTQDGDSVSSGTAYNRVTTYAQYIGWLEKHFYPHSDGATERYMCSLRPSKMSNQNDAADLLWDNYKSLTKQNLIRIMDVMRPDSTENPWLNEGIRHRNHLMALLFERLGIRRSELARIQLGDLKRNPRNNQYVLRIRKDIDMDDHRHNRPQAKTLGRMLPVNSILAQEIHDYEINHRARVAGVEHTEYLFVTHNKTHNTPISLEAINKVFRKISEVVGFEVHPHRFRHSWNDRYSEHVDAQILKGRLNQEKAETDRQKLMGWSPDSTMAKRYAMRYTIKQSLQAGMALQDQENAEKAVFSTQYDDSDIDF